MNFCNDENPPPTDDVLHENSVPNHTENNDNGVNLREPAIQNELVDNSAHGDGSGIFI